MLGSERLTGAILDRLTHRCKIIETKGESYRLRDAKARRGKKPPAGQAEVPEPVDNDFASMDEEAIEE